MMKHINFTRNNWNYRVRIPDNLLTGWTEKWNSPSMRKRLAKIADFLNKKFANQIQNHGWSKWTVDSFGWQGDKQEHNTKLDINDSNKVTPVEHTTKQEMEEILKPIYGVQHKDDRPQPKQAKITLYEEDANAWEKELTNELNTLLTLSKDEQQNKIKADKARLDKELPLAA